jgi:hypothetical protein
MTEIKIDKGVPMPARNGIVKVSFPLESMTPGDSFFVASDPGKSAQSKANQVRHASYEKKIDVYIRFVTENRIEGVRVWRK